MDNLWLINGKLLTSDGPKRRALLVSGGRISALRSSTPQGRTRRIDLQGAYLVPGFIDLHVWGSPDAISRDVVKSGTTAFLATLGPAPTERLTKELAERTALSALPGAQSLGLHLEGPFLNPARGGALPRRWMRRAAPDELARLTHAGRRRIKLMTLAPELPGALDVVRWCRRHGVVASLGHSEASADIAMRAVEAGARAVTHVFNGMAPFHHRQPSLLDVALMDDRLITMVILDGVHISPAAFQLLVCAKGVERIALVTDSIAQQGWPVTQRGGAFYLKDGTLAGSALTMINAVRNAIRFAGVSIADAVRMATEVPARLLSDRARGVLRVGARADLVAFDQNFRVLLTMVGGQVVYRRSAHSY